MKSKVVVIGIGEMGAVFSRGLLRMGHPVYPVTRDVAADEVAEAVGAPSLALVCVGERDLAPVLRSLPARWKERAGLLQNELVPRDWQAHGIVEPTVAVVWFEKKRGRPLTPILPTLVAGPRAALLVEALRAIDVPADEIDAGEALLRALVVKNLYVLTANIGGLAVGGGVAVGELWRDHRDVATEVFDEVFAIQQWLAGRELPRDELLAEMVRAFEADPEHGAMGRSAPARLARARDHALAAGIPVPRLDSIATRDSS